MREQILKLWGYFEVLFSSKELTVKKITVKAGRRLSLQDHMNRDELWYPIKGSGKFEISGKIYNVNDVESFGMFKIPRETKHRASANSSKELTFIEISVGKFDEDDITRYEDDYGRK